MYKLTLIFVSLCVVSVYSVVEILPKEDPPAKYAGQPGCYNPQEDIMLEVGKPYFPEGKCVEYLCESEGATKIFSCGVVYADNCTVTEDLTKPYPDCCPKPAEDCKSFTAVL